MKGYDGHILFSNLAKLKLKNPPKVIAQSLEKFMSIKLGTLEFKDSLQFLTDLTNFIFHIEMFVCLNECDIEVISLV